MEKPQPLNKKELIASADEMLLNSQCGFEVEKIRELERNLRIMAGGQDVDLLLRATRLNEYAVAVENLVVCRVFDPPLERKGFDVGLSKVVVGQIQRKTGKGVKLVTGLMFGIKSLEGDVGVFAGNSHLIFEAKRHLESMHRLLEYFASHDSSEGRFVYIQANNLGTAVNFELEKKGLKLVVNDSEKVIADVKKSIFGILRILSDRVEKLKTHNGNMPYEKLW